MYGKFGYASNDQPSRGTLALIPYRLVSIARRKPIAQEHRAQPVRHELGRVSVVADPEAEIALHQENGVRQLGQIALRQCLSAIGVT